MNLRKTCLLVMLAIGCAAAPRPRTESAQIKDSAPERAASLRSADRSLGLEAEEERWGIAAARERREVAEAQHKERQRKPASPAAPGPVDLRRGPGAPPVGDQTAK